MSQHMPERRTPGRPRCPRSIRRRTDRVRSGAGWAVLLAGLITLVLAVVAGQSAYDDGLARIERDAAARATVVGTLLDDARSARTEPATRARVSYVDPAGRPQIGEITVTGRLPAGTPVRVEVDGDGRVGAERPSRGDAVLSAVAAASGIVVIGWLLLVLAWFGILKAITARNEKAWEREWRLIEPQWSGRDRRL